MNRIITFLSKHQVFLITLLFVIVINLSLLSNSFQVISTVFYSVIAIALILSLIIDKEIFFYVTVFFVPLSFVMEQGDTLAIFFPSELLAVLLFIYLSFDFFIKGKLDSAVLKHPVTVIILIDFLWMIITSCTSTMPMVSFKRTVVKLLYIGIYYFFSLVVFKKIKNIKKIYVLYILGLLFPIYNSVVFHSKYNFSIKVAYKMTMPFYADHTIYGACLAFLIPFIILFIAESKHGKKFFWLVISIIFFGAIFLSYSRASWVSLILIFLLYLGTYFKVRMKFIVLFVAFMSVFGYLGYKSLKNEIKSIKSVSNKDVGQHIESMGNVNTDASNTERLNRWYCAWKMFLDKPLFGFGSGTYQFQYGQYQIKELVTRISTYKGDKGNAHSDYFGFLSETGLIGLLIFLSMIFSTMKLGLQNIYNQDSKYKNLSMALLLGLTTFFIEGLFNSFIDTDKIMMLVFCGMAGLVAIDLHNKKLISS